VRGNVDDPAVLAAAARTADAFIHTAAASDGKDAERDAALLDAVLPVLAGTGKPYVHTSGVWVHGSGIIDEQIPFDPPQRRPTACARSSSPPASCTAAASACPTW
jgi:nucleoside-diphosphate-sugar epimerase